MGETESEDVLVWAARPGSGFRHAYVRVLKVESEEGGEEFVLLRTNEEMIES